MESLSAINLYVWPVDDFNVILYGQPMIFMFLLKSFSFDRQLLIFYLHSSEESKGLKTSTPKGNARQQLSEFNFPRLC